MQKNCLLFLLTVLSICACRKGEVPDEHYFGQVKLEVLNFSDAVKVDVYLNDKKLGVINPQERPYDSYNLAAGQSGKLKIYKAGSDTLIADTTISIQPNTTQAFRVGYSESLKLKGFVSEVNVPADSVRVQILYNVRRANNRREEVELHLYNIFLEDQGIVEGLKPDDPNPKIFTYPALDSNGWDPIFYARIKDVKTGEFLTFGGMDYFLFLSSSSEYAGHYLFLDINDDDENYITTNVTVL
jgi:hypothetical protein